MGEERGMDLICQTLMSGYMYVYLSLTHIYGYAWLDVQEPNAYSKEEMKKLTERLQASNAETGGLKLIASGR